MEQIYLINQQTFAGYEDISINVKPERILFFVKKAQELDLKTFLGNPLYFDFMKWFNADGTQKENTPQPYIDLWNGCWYTNRAGHNIYYEGLIPTMVYFTFARFIEGDSIHYTASGPVVKRHDAGDALKPGEITRLVQHQRSIANAHANEVQNFIVDQKQNYPLYFYNSQIDRAKQPGPRIRGVDKTKYNGYANYPNTPYDPFSNIIN
jgi:hypothetical protein